MNQRIIENIGIKSTNCIVSGYEYLIKSIAYTGLNKDIIWSSIKMSAKNSNIRTVAAAKDIIYKVVKNTDVEKLYSKYIGDNNHIYTDEQILLLGKAIHNLVPAGDQGAEERTLRRFNQMATSSDMVELAQHLRSIIELLRANGIPLDYVNLAGDLYNYQLVDYQNTVRLKWGREYYYVKEQDNKEENHD